jgi:hypothetical protein
MVPVGSAMNGNTEGKAFALLVEEDDLGVFSNPS